MVMLMVNLLQSGMTTQEFFQDVIFEQNVKTKTRHFTMTFLKAEDFWQVLKDKGIRSKNSEHANLREFLQLDQKNPQLFLLKNIRKTLEQMSENDAFMEAIQEDVLSNEEKEKEEAEYAKIERGEDISDGDYQHDGTNQESKLETVKEGNETYAMTTHDRGNILALSGSGMQARNSDGLDNTASMGNTASAGQPIF